MVVSREIDREKKCCRRELKSGGIKGVSMKQKFKKWLMFCLCSLIAIGISGCWGLASVRSRNIRQAQRELDVVKKELGSDTRFSELMFLVSTTNLGDNIVVAGSVPDQASLDYLKLLIKMEISTKFNVRYSVDIKQEYDKSIQPVEADKTISSDKDKQTHMIGSSITHAEFA